jgi:hypothetical protein
MRMPIQTFSQLALVIAAVILNACSAAQAPIHSSNPRSAIFDPGLNVAQAFSTQSISGVDLGQPALIATDDDTGALESWPIQLGGSNSPQTISPPLAIASDDLAAHGSVVAIAASNQGVILYDVVTGAQTMLSDPFGSTVGITMDENENIFVGNSAQPKDSIVMYPAHDRQHPRDLTGCGWIKIAVDVAADDEGDVFVSAFTQKGAARIIELPNGPNGPDPKHCVPLDLKPHHGQFGFTGIVVDPKTDDLVTLDNPDCCQGGSGPRMVVYPKPYSRTTGRAHDFNTLISFGIKLSADSSKVFIGMVNTRGNFTLVDQRSFPDGRDEGSYTGGDPGGFTTIPNTLPN